MALEFKPPTDLVNAYLQRPSPGQEASAGIQQALQMYAQQKAQQQQVALTQQQRDIEMAKGIGEGGQDFTDAYKQIQASHAQPQTPSLIDRWHAFVGNKQGQPAQSPGMNPQPSPGGVPPPTASTATVSGAPPAIPPQGPPVAQSFLTAEGQLDQPAMSAYKKQHGSKGMADVEKQLALSNTLHTAYDRTQPVPVMTKDEALKAGKVSPNTKIVEPKDTSAKDQKYDNEQNRLEGQAIDRLSKLRGDQSLARTENQRDAAIQAYNTIERVKQEGRMPSQLEYYDILGQMWKARTGASPTDQALKDLDAKTFKGDLGKAYQYFSGKPAGVTTGDVLQNIQDFAADSGLQSDKFHSSYMDSHKLKPSGLEQSRWDPIFNSHRGMSFVDATGYKPKETAAAHQAYADPSKEERYQKWKASQSR